MLMEAGGAGSGALGGTSGSIDPDADEVLVRMHSHSVPARRERGAPQPQRVQRARAFAMLGTSLVVGLVPTVGGELGMLPAFQRPFVERDPNLSWPSVQGSIVSATALWVLSMLLPVAAVWGTQVALARASQRVAAAQVNALALAVHLLSSVLLTMAVTDVLKVYVGRQRPHFYAACDYAGFASKGMDAYLEATSAGAPGHLSKCLADPSAYSPQALLSFPSGHASMSFCGLGFLGFYWAWAVSTASGPRAWWGQAASTAAAAPPFLGAALIACSRTRDGHHHFDDVAAGAALGCVIAAAGARAALRP